MDKSIEFFNKVKSDPALQQKIAAVKNQAKEHAAKKIVEIAKEAGYDLDEKSLEDAFMSKKGELSEQALEQVSAGGGGRGNCGSGSAPLY